MGFIGRAVAPTPITANDVPDLPASKITSGTFANNRISASSVSQHATSFDDNNIVNDLSTLGLRVHTQENLNASNSNSASFDVFQDDSGIGATSNATRSVDEFVFASTTGTDNSVVFLINGNGTNGSSSGIVDATGNHTIGYSGVAWNTNRYKWGTSSLYFYNDYLYMADSNDWTYSNSGNGWTFECWCNQEDTGAGFLWYQGLQSGNGNPRNHFATDSNTSLSFYDQQQNLSFSETCPDLQNTWRHVAIVYDDANNQLQFAVDGTWLGSARSYANPSNNSNQANIGRGQNSSGGRNYFNGWIDGVKVSTRNQYVLGTNFTPPASQFDDQTTTQGTSGNFTSTAITTSSTSSMGAVITYQDNAGTNALNTDIILQLSADNGSNFSTATLTALPDFATGIKMAKVNDLSVTAGTQLKYKILFANQSNSKNARIRGVSLQY